MKNLKLSGLLAFFILLSQLSLEADVKRTFEDLDRGGVALQKSDGVYLTWRLLQRDSINDGFNVFRDGVKINSEPILNSTNYMDEEGTVESIYNIETIHITGEMEKSNDIKVWPFQGDGDLAYKTIKIPKAPSAVGTQFTPGDMSIGDLDGDGDYELVFQWEPSTGVNNFFDAIDMEGNHLWRISGGPNTSTNEYAFLVYDFDGDGKAEVAFKTAPGTKDGTGHYLSKGPAANDDDSKILKHDASGTRLMEDPSYITVFEGSTGRELATVNYWPSIGPLSSMNSTWGDNYGHRSSSIKCAVLHNKEVGPVMVFTRGIYTRIAMAGYTWNGESITKIWQFDTDQGYNEYRGQGNHSLAVGDVDNDGSDELMYGACAIDDDGTGLYSTGRGHGDSHHLTDHDPDHPGLEYFQPHENDIYGLSMRDAATGEILWERLSPADVGRAWAADADPRYRGSEVIPIGLSNYTCKGTAISTTYNPYDQPIWFDGDLTRDVRNQGTCINDGYGSLGRILTGYHYGATSIHFTKDDANLVADIIGDWREEVVLKNAANTEFILFTTWLPTQYRKYCLMQDPVYHMNVVVQNVGYNQPSAVGYYFLDETPVPNIQVKRDVKLNNKIRAPWKYTSIGNPSLPGYAEMSGNEFRLYATGINTERIRDELSFVHQQMLGDGEIIAHLNSPDSDYKNAFAGIMMRESLTEGSKYVMVSKKTNNKTHIYGRLVDDKVSGGGESSIQYPDAWVKITRVGNRFSFYISEDKSNWQLMAASNVGMANTIYVGVVGSSDSLKRTEVVVDDVQLISKLAGTLKMEQWFNVEGNSVADLEALETFPGSPDVSQYVEGYDIASENMFDNYGTKISGYLRVPLTGDYQFSIVANESAELYLSTDSLESNRQRIAYLTSASEVDQWNANTGQSSDPITLSADRLYYIEALHKEGTGEDFLKVRWSGPGFENEMLTAKNTIASLDLLTATSRDEVTTTKHRVSVYPNPASSHIQVDMPQSEETYKLAIVDMQGRKLKEMTTNQSSVLINTTDLKKGMYLLMLSTENQGLIQSVRFLIN